MIDSVARDIQHERCQAKNPSALVEKDYETRSTACIFSIQASRNAAPMNKTNNHASPASNRATLADIPHKAPTIAAVRSSSALRNEAAPVNGFSYWPEQEPSTRRGLQQQATSERGLLSIGSDYCGGSFGYL